VTLRAERQSARMSKITNDILLNLAWHWMLYSCTHMPTMVVKVLIAVQVNFSVHALKSEAEFRRRRAVIHEISHNILVASTQFERPFDYSTSSWVKDNDCRGKNVSKLRAVQRHYADSEPGQPVSVDISRVKGADQFSYFMKSVSNPPYIRFTVPGTVPQYCCRTSHNEHKIYFTIAIYTRRPRK